jgi:hypothetical protein
LPSIFSINLRMPSMFMKPTLYLPTGRTRFVVIGTRLREGVA